MKTSHALLVGVLAMTAACKKTPIEKVEAECSKRYKGTPDVEKRLELARSCLQVYRREVFDKDTNYNPRTRGPEGSAAPENLHFLTVLGEIESICNGAGATTGNASQCKALCTQVAEYRTVFPNFFVDADGSQSASVHDLRGLCARDFGVSIPKPK